jgi:hypothetical protein
MKEFPPFHLDTVNQPMARLGSNRPLWPNTHVQPEVLKSHIFEVRTALGDDSKKPLFIETLPRRGYRFIAPVSDGVAPGLSVASATGRLVDRDRPLARCEKPSSTR